MKKTEEGSMLDPDARFLLANERTLLAWVRTALALVGGGLVLTQIGDKTDTQIMFGIGAILFGALTAFIGYSRYLVADKAIRANKLPSAGRGPGLQVIMVISFALIVAIIEVARLW